MFDENDKADGDPLLKDLELTLDLYGISATRFGYFAVGDPALVGRVRKGMLLRDRRRQKVAKALDRIRQNGGMPA